MAQIRGVGIPFPFQGPANGDGVVTLGSGGIYVLPPGEFVPSLGPQTQIQWFDPVLGGWRTMQDCGFMISSDGSNYRLLNMSGVVVGASITNAGSGGTNGIGSTATGVSVSLGLPVSGLSSAGATMYPIVGGSVQAPTIVQNGSGFLVPPLILIDPPPAGGIQATATASINASGGISAITMQTVGAGYSASPGFWIFPQPPTSYNSVAGVASAQFPAPGNVYPTNMPPGAIYQQNLSLSGAQLSSNPLTGSGTLTGLAVLNFGSGYDGTHIPSIGITGCGPAAATAIMSMTITSVTLGSGGSGYGTGAPPDWASSLGMVLISGQQINNQVLVPRCGRGVTTVTAGAVATFVVEDGGFGLQKVPTISVLNTSAVATGQATGTAVVGGAVDYNVLQGRVQ